MQRCHKTDKALLTEWFVAAAGLPADWDDELGEDDFLRRASLAEHEAARLSDVTPRYALLRNDGRILARAAFQLLRVQPRHLKESAIPGWQFSVWKIFTRAASPKLLVGGQLFRHDVASVQWSVALPAYDAFMWYRDALEALGRKTRALAALLKELPTGLTPHFLHQAPEYLLLRNDISMELPIPPAWQTMTDYEKSLKHKYAQRYRKVRQAWTGLRVGEMNAEEVASASGRIYELYQQVTANQPVRMGLLNATFIPTLKAAYSDSLKVWGIWEGEVMVAFASGWVRDGSFDMFYIGFDYERNAALNLYFNILFFAIEQAISLKKPLLILGRTALEAKARVGCRPQYLNTFLYVRNPLLRGIVARLQARLGEGGSEWEQRHPFKNQD